MTHQNLHEAAKGFTEKSVALNSHVKKQRGLTSISLNNYKKESKIPQERRSKEVIKIIAEIKET